MTYDFYADETDKIEILKFIFKEKGIQVFDLGSPPGQEIAEYKTTDEIVSKFDLRNGDKFAVTFQLWSPRLKGDVVFRKVDLDPKYCNGHTFRYATSGQGLIQLYFGGVQNNELNISHIGHQSQKRAQAYARSDSEMAAVNKWDWGEVEKVARALKYQIHNRMAVKKIGAVGVLPGADRATEQGIKYR